MGLEDIADELYALPAAEFTAARDARVAELRAERRRDLAGEVKALRRPSAAAEALNHLVRARPGAAAGLVAVGDQLRAAQSRLAAADLRALGRQRREVVAALVRATRDLAREQGRPLSTAVEREVAATLEAALVDPAAAAMLGSGRLTRALEHSGIGPVDLDGAVGGPVDVAAAPAAAPPVEVASTGDGPQADKAMPDPGETAAAEAAAAALAEAAEAAAAADVAESAAAEAERALADVVERAAAAGLRVDEARARVADLEGQLADARAKLASRTEEATRLEGERRKAEVHAAERGASAEEARRRAEHLRGEWRAGPAPEAS